MRIYEELFIVKPDATEEEVDQFIEQMKTVVTSAGGTVDKVDKWGKRQAGLPRGQVPRRRLRAVPVQRRRRRR